MSKFTVLVIGPEDFNSLSDVLEPYDIHVEFPPYVVFTREDKAAERKERIKRMRELFHGGSLGTEQPITKGFYAGLFASNIKELQKIEAMSDEEYFLDQTKYYELAQQTTSGKPISTENPNTKFNKWVFLHRLWVKKNGKNETAAKKKDIDFSFISRVDASDAMVNWTRMINGDYSYYVKNMMYDYWENESKEEYIYRKSLFMTSAYILHGKWYERGTIGWWAHVDNEIPYDKWIEQYEDMLKKVKPDTVLTTIECWI